MERANVCSFDPRPELYDAPLSRGKRNLNVLIHDLQRTKRDPLATVNEMQDHPTHNPKVCHCFTVTRRARYKKSKALTASNYKLLFISFIMGKSQKLVLYKNFL